MRRLFLLLVLVCCCRGDDATDKTSDSGEAVTTLSTQSPVSTSRAVPTTALVSTLTTTKAGALSSADTSITPTTLSPTTTLSGSSTVPPSISPASPGTNVPSTSGAGTSPKASTLSPTVSPPHSGTSTLPPANTPVSADTSTPSPKTSATPEGTKAAVSTATGSVTPHSSATPLPTAATVFNALSSAPASAATSTFVTTPAADVSRPTTSIRGSSATSPPQKTRTSEGTTVQSSGVPADKENATQPGHETATPVATKEGATTPGATTVATTRQAGGVPQADGSLSSTMTTSTVVPMTTSTSSSHHASTPGRKARPSDALLNNQVICEEQLSFSESEVVLTLNESRPCASPINETLHTILCTAAKATFNRSRDSCVVRVATAPAPSHQIAVLDVSVQTHTVPKELFELLGTKKEELQKVGISNVTYAHMRLEEDNEDRLSMPLVITIVCMACTLLLIAAIYGCCHQRIAHRKDQQRLTEELQTMENGYHDNPTLEVMETPSEMQEKKVNLNGELGDSWIVPMDNLTKEDLEEEDTHL
uniref:Podocalyxin n=1 Tax=Pelodiscus sinensis TaxID=13735 RepID=K7FZ93_PELSI|nr:podocalyxin isoform X1 [Pelodiscus sinensis]|eukprot:XP_006120409.1 podocalyxin isoform X1 [Pelodiscus sinensis]